LFNFGKLQWIGLHGIDFIIFRSKVLEILNFEYFASLKNSISKVLMEIGFWNYAKEVFPIKFQSILWYPTTLVALTLIILFSSILKFSKMISKITKNCEGKY